MLDFNSSIQLQKLCDAVLFVIEALWDKETDLHKTSGGSKGASPAMAYIVVNWFSGKLIKSVPPEVRF